MIVMNVSQSNNNNNNNYELLKKSKHLLWHLFLSTAGRTKDWNEKEEREVPKGATKALHMKNYSDL